MSDQETRRCHHTSRVILRIKLQKHVRKQQTTIRQLKAETVRERSYLV